LGAPESYDALPLNKSPSELANEANLEEIIINPNISSLVIMDWDGTGGPSLAPVFMKVVEHFETSFDHEAAAKLLPKYNTGDEDAKAKLAQLFADALLGLSQQDVVDFATDYFAINPLQTYPHVQNGFEQLIESDYGLIISTHGCGDVNKHVLEQLPNLIALSTAKLEVNDDGIYKGKTLLPNKAAVVEWAILKYRERISDDGDYMRLTAFGDSKADFDMLKAAKEYNGLAVFVTSPFHANHHLIEEAISEGFLILNIQDDGWSIS
jgi:phosphoserine phosphatase